MAASLLGLPISENRRMDNVTCETFIAYEKLIRNSPLTNKDRELLSRYAKTLQNMAPAELKTAKIRWQSILSTPILLRLPSYRIALAGVFFPEGRLRLREIHRIVAIQLDHLNARLLLLSDKRFQRSLGRTPPDMERERSHLCIRITTIKRRFTLIRMECAYLTQKLIEASDILRRLSASPDRTATPLQLTPPPIRTSDRAPSATREPLTPVLTHSVPVARGLCGCAIPGDHLAVHRYEEHKGQFLH